VGWRIASLLSPFDAEKVKVPERVEDSSLADLWVDFLLKETGKEEGRPKIGGGKIYESIASPAHSQSTNSFSTPQPLSRQAVQPAPPVYSTPQVSAAALPVQAPVPVYSTPQPQAAPALSVSSGVGRPVVPLGAQPIALPAHLRPSFAVSSRHAPLPAFHLTNHPVLHHPLPRMTVPGLPVSAGVRPASPVLGAGDGVAGMTPVNTRFGSTSPVPMTPTLLTASLTVPSAASGLSQQPVEQRTKTPSVG
jgi:hypothetical protein